MDSCDPWWPYLAVVGAASLSATTIACLASFVVKRCRADNEETEQLTSSALQEAALLREKTESGRERQKSDMAAGMQKVLDLERANIDLIFETNSNRNTNTEQQQQQPTLLLKKVACVVCMDQDACILLPRCGHLCLCTGCYSKLWVMGQMRCPLCKTS